MPSFQFLHTGTWVWDCAGKATVLYSLQFNEFINLMPTKPFNTEKIKVTLGNSKTVTVHFWELGGQVKSRLPWKSNAMPNDIPIWAVIGDGVKEGLEKLHDIIIKWRKLL
ncbi:ADP-ribosylation factor-like protein 4A [Galemys pyrenaicus]|uniref:ADP-ribosylation factor-like protein 4A n=1 Tax=Galemys pyrenaicus TaxID=202257 RepID=A0A8J6AF48_GALPY|nr:ADP-ribosylation factor-like protein 4A [Galemys pyrenaicus]